MNWFDTSGLTNLAKTALKEAQKTIDKALDIQDESGEEQEGGEASGSGDKVGETASPGSAGTPQKDDFFSSWGLTVSAESAAPRGGDSVVTESPSKAQSQSVWGSFAGSFFEEPDEAAIVRPPKAKSMNVIAEVLRDCPDDAFSRSQLVMTDMEPVDLQRDLAKDETAKVNERRSSSRSAGLSLLSSRNSSDSVEVLSQSLKTTPDSETASVHSISHSSSAGQKQNSESVEIIPDSLVSPSSIECLGFDSYSSDKNSTPSSNTTPELDESDKKSTPIGEQTQKTDTADSVSLVADDDEDTMSYNSISECTAPTILDKEEKAGPIFKGIKTDLKRPELLSLELPLLQKSLFSESSSNDGSWSDRTLHPDETTAEPDERRETDADDTLTERLSDSSSFYNVNMSSEMLKSDTFISIDKCNSNESSQKDCTVKERTSPTSSDSKSDLVKVSSGRTSGHTSGDDLETATSSDIEIIPSPNGDARGTPVKAKLAKLDGATSPNLVDLVLGKSLAMKIRGHQRELSELSVLSAASDDSAPAEHERQLRRLCEMAEVLDAREAKIVEMSRINAELSERAAGLAAALDAARAGPAPAAPDADEYTQRLAALEKKFQQAIREKDALRSSLDALRDAGAEADDGGGEGGGGGGAGRALRERDAVIAQLTDEGEALARRQLQHTNIIKKLRAKEKDNEAVVKGLRDKVASLTADAERLRRGAAAREQLETSQQEAVHRLTAGNRRLEAELNETKSVLEDTSSRLQSARQSLDAARAAAAAAVRGAGEAAAARDARAAAEREADAARRDADVLRAQLQQLRAEMQQEDRRWSLRTQRLESELEAARAVPAPADPAPLVAQLAAAQRDAARAQAAAAAARADLHRARESTAASLAASSSALAGARDEAAAAARARAAAEAARGEAAAAARAEAARAAGLQARVAELEAELESKSVAFESEIVSLRAALEAARRGEREAEAAAAAERAAAEAERRRVAILQEQLSSRGDVSPAPSAASDAPPALWGSEEWAGLPAAGAAGAGGGVEAAAAAARRAAAARAGARREAALERTRRELAARLAQLQQEHDDCRRIAEQYEALLQMYGEKEEQLAEARLDLSDVTQLYKAQLDELVALRRAAAADQ